MFLLLKTSKPFTEFFPQKEMKTSICHLRWTKMGTESPWCVNPAQGWCFQTHTSIHTQRRFPQSFKRKDRRQLDEVGRLCFPICKMGRAPPPSQDCCKDYYPKRAFKNSTVKSDINMSPLTHPFNWIHRSQSDGPGDFIAHVIQLLHFVALGWKIRVDKALASPCKLTARPTLDLKHWGGTHGQMAFCLHMSADHRVL